MGAQNGRVLVDDGNADGARQEGEQEMDERTRNSWARAWDRPGPSNSLVKHFLSGHITDGSRIREDNTLCTI
jgi:hypothetical protein